MVNWRLYFEAIAELKSHVGMIDVFLCWVQ